MAQVEHEVEKVRGRFRVWPVGTRAAHQIVAICDSREDAERIAKERSKPFKSYPAAFSVR